MNYGDMQLFICLTRQFLKLNIPTTFLFYCYVLNIIANIITNHIIRKGLETSNANSNYTHNIKTGPK